MSKGKNSKLNPVTISNMTTDLLKFIEKEWSDSDPMERMAAFKSAASLLENVIHQGNLAAMMILNLEKFSK